MLGEFELPGSEQRTERVGGSSNEPGKADGEAKQDGQQQSASAGGSGRQAPSAGSAAPKNDPNAKAEGIQVSELKTDPDAGQGGPPASEKPPAVKIGDPAMQIQPISGGQTEVVGQQQVGQSQQFEKATPQGKQQGDNRNKGVEKGRTMPAGM